LTDPASIGQISMDLTKYRLDLDKSNQISASMTKPETDKYNPKRPEPVNPTRISGQFWALFLSI